MGKELEKVNYNPAHKQLRIELGETVMKYKDRMLPSEAMAVIANFLGGFTALQRDIYDSQMAEELILKNMEQGNREAIFSMVKPQGNA